MGWFNKLFRPPAINGKVPLRWPLADEKLKPFFIVSSGRSGTTLLRKKLLGSELIHIPPESDDLIPWNAQVFLNENHLEWEQLSGQILENFQKAQCFKFWDLNKTDLLREQIKSIPPNDRSYAKLIYIIYSYHGYMNKPLMQTWGDKTPYLIYHLDWLRGIFPNAIYIHVVRDGRAVVHSMMKRQNYSLRKAAIRWRDSLRLFDAHLKKIDSGNALEIKYEDLVKDTKAVMEDICKFIGVSFKENMLDDHSALMGDDILPHHEHVHDNITTDFLEKWKNELASNEIQLLNTWLFKELKSRHYNVSYDRF